MCLVTTVLIEKKWERKCGDGESWYHGGTKEMREKESVKCDREEREVELGDLIKTSQLKQAPKIKSITTTKHR